MTKKLRISMTHLEARLGWLYLALELFVLPYLLQRLNALLPAPLSNAWVNFCFFLINFTWVSWVFRAFLRKSLAAIGKAFGRFLKATVLGFVAYWAANLALSFAIAWLWPGFSNVNDSAIADLAGLNFPVMAIGTVLLVPTVEELLCRGLFFQGLYNRNRRLAYAVSAAFFAAIHVAGYWGSCSPAVLALCFVQYLPAGLILGWTYTQCDNIFAPILIHTVINAMGIFSLVR